MVLTCRLKLFSLSYTISLCPASKVITSIDACYGVGVSVGPGVDVSVGAAGVGVSVGAAAGVGVSVDVGAGVAVQCHVTETAFAASPTAV